MTDSRPIDPCKGRMYFVDDDGVLREEPQEGGVSVTSPGWGRKVHGTSSAEPGGGGGDALSVALDPSPPGDAVQLAPNIDPAEFWKRSRGHALKVAMAEDAVFLAAIEHVIQARLAERMAEVREWLLSDDARDAAMEYQAPEETAGGWSDGGDVFNPDGLVEALSRRFPTGTEPPK